MNSGVGGGHCKKHIFTLLKDGLEGCKSMERAREKFINLTEIFGKYWLQQKKKNIVFLCTLER